MMNEADAAFEADFRVMLAKVGLHLAPADFLAALAGAGRLRAQAAALAVYVADLTAQDGVK
jgi:hypothetical protein